MSFQSVGRVKGLDATGLGDLDASTGSRGQCLIELLIRNRCQAAGAMSGTFRNLQCRGDLNQYLKLLIFIGFTDLKKS